MSASWYDVLGVDESASTEEIRAAWKDSIADLSPGDRKFRTYNEAAEVLLDPERRAAYDAEIGVEQTEEPEEPEELEAEEPATTADDEPTDEPEAPAEPVAKQSARTYPAVPTWLIGALAVSLLLVAGAAAYFQLTGTDSAEIEQSAREATSAARTSVPLVFTYDYRFPERDRDRALKVLTGDLKTQYAELWKKAIAPNLERTQGFAKTTVANAGVACVSDDGQRVGVLVVLDSENGNVKQTSQITIAFTATMIKEGGDWLVRDISGWDPRELTEAAEGGSGSASPSASPSAPDAEASSGTADCAAD